MGVAMILWTENVEFLSIHDVTFLGVIDVRKSVSEEEQPVNIKPDKK